MEERIYYLSNTVIPNTKRKKNIHVFNVFTQVGVKQLTDFLRTVTAASDLVGCTLVNCDTDKVTGHFARYKRNLMAGVRRYVTHELHSRSLEFHERKNINSG